MSKTQDEVEKFLQDLDILTSKKVSSSKVPAVVSKIPPVSSSTPLSSTQQTVAPVLSQTVSQPIPSMEISHIPVQSTLVQQTVVPQSAHQKNQQPNVVVAAPPSMIPPPVGQGISKQKVKKATHGYVPLAAPVIVQDTVEPIQNTQTYQEWNLTSLWNKASKVAESTARVVAGNENVLKMAETVNSNLNKLAETLAPKIEVQHESGFLADRITLWICVEAEPSISRDILKDYTYSIVNGLWLNPVNNMCKSIRVNNVDHSETFISNSLQEAIHKAEGMVTGLQRLSDEALQQNSPGVDKNGSSNQVNASVIMVVQQICLPVSSKLLDDPAHTFFLVTLVCDTPELGFISCSSCSQSIVNPVGFVKADSLWTQWESSQRIRVLETVVGDILEEFIAKLGHIRQLNTN